MSVRQSLALNNTKTRHEFGTTTLMGFGNIAISVYLC